MADRQQRPITHPTPPSSYRHLAIDMNGVCILADFKAARRAAAVRAAGDSSLSASVLFNSSGEVIFGRMPDDQVEKFRRAFSLKAESCPSV